MISEQGNPVDGGRGGLQIRFLRLERPLPQTDLGGAAARVRDLGGQGGHRAGSAEAEHLFAGCAAAGNGSHQDHAGTPMGIGRERYRPETCHSMECSGPACGCTVMGKEGRLRDRPRTALEQSGATTVAPGAARRPAWPAVRSSAGSRHRLGDRQQRTQAPLTAPCQGRYRSDRGRR